MVLLVSSSCQIGKRRDVPEIPPLFLLKHASDAGLPVLSVGQSIRNKNISLAPGRPAPPLSGATARNATRTAYAVCVAASDTREPLRGARYRRGGDHVLKLPLLLSLTPFARMTGTASKTILFTTAG